MKYLIGIDIGTTSAKALLIDEDGKVVASATHDYPLSTPKPMWSEQNPEDWWKAAVVSFREIFQKSAVPPGDVAGIGLSGQMHGLVLLDAKGQVVRPAILWNDQRTGPQCKRITEQVGFERLLDLTGNPVLPGFTAPKIAWVRENEPDAFARAVRFLLPKDYIRWRLTGEFATEVSDASGTSLLDVKKRAWSEEMFRALDIPLSFAPPCFESVEISGRIGAEAAETTGLAAGTPVAGGGGDQACQAVGTGIVSEGSVSVTIGTSGVVFAPTNAPHIDPRGRLHAFCHAVPNLWHVMGVMLAAGGSLRWYRDTVCDSEVMMARRLEVDPYKLIMEEAMIAPVGCEGLFFLPYLSGERTPHPDPNARGAFFGLTMRHTRRHLARAVVEGVSYGLRDSLELIRKAGISPKSVRASGGGSRSKFWRQVLANVFGMRITTVNAPEGAALGAALIAGAGAGVFSDLREACDRIVRDESELLPQRYEVEFYERSYKIYASLYERFKPAFDLLSAGK